MIDVLGELANLCYQAEKRGLEFEPVLETEIKLCRITTSLNDVQVVIEKVKRMLEWS